MCHGMEGKGYAMLRTPDFTTAKVQACITDEQMKDIIENGKKGTAMKAWKGQLKPEEIEAVMKFIRSLGPKKK